MRDQSLALSLFALAVASRSSEPRPESVETLTRLVPGLVGLIACTASFVFLALSLRTIPIDIAYAMSARLGVVLIAFVEWFWFRRR